VQLKLNIDMSLKVFGIILIYSVTIIYWHSIALALRSENGMIVLWQRTKITPWRRAVCDMIEERFGSGVKCHCIRCIVMNVRMKTPTTMRL